MRGGPELAGQDAGGHADIAHPQADRGDLGLADHVQDPQVVAGMVGHGRDLDDVRIELRKAAVNLVKVVGRLAEIVETDDPLGLAVAGDFAGNVVFQVDVFDAFDNCRPQQELTLLLRAGPFAAVGRAAAGDDHGARPIGKQATDVDGPADIVQTQFDQLGPLLGKVPVFGDHVTMAAATDTDANHSWAREIRVRESLEQIPSTHCNFAPEVQEDRPAAEGRNRHHPKVGNVPEVGVIAAFSLLIFPGYKISQNCTDAVKRGFVHLAKPFNDQGL